MQSTPVCTGIPHTSVRLSVPRNRNFFLLLLPLLVLCACQPIRPITAAGTTLPSSPTELTLNPDLATVSLVDWVEDFAQPLNNGYQDYPAGTQTFLDIITQQPATANREPTAVDCALRSRASRKLVSLSFHNNAERTVDVYWLDFDGNEVYYFSVRPHRAIDQQTYVTHPWCIRDTETKEAVLAVTAADQTATVEIK